jgi:hypothetical protein
LLKTPQKYRVKPGIFGFDAQKYPFILNFFLEVGREWPQIVINNLA